MEAWRNKNKNSDNPERNCRLGRWLLFKDYEQARDDKKKEIFILLPHSYVAGSHVSLFPTYTNGLVDCQPPSSRDGNQTSRRENKFIWLTREKPRSRHSALVPVALTHSQLRLQLWLLWHSDSLRGSVWRERSIIAATMRKKLLKEVFWQAWKFIFLNFLECVLVRKSSALFV